MARAFDQTTTFQFEASAENRCPECGQSLYPTAVEQSQRSHSSPWLPWVLVGIGLYLILAFRGQMLLDAEFLPSPELQSACWQPPTIRSVNPKLCERFVQDRQQFEHDEAAVAVGGLVLFLGVVRLVQQGLAAFRLFELANHVPPTEHTNRCRFLAIALGIWTLAERLLLLGLQCLLLVAGAALIAWVANGTPLSVDLVNVAIRRAVDAAFDLKLMVS